MMIKKIIVRTLLVLLTCSLCLLIYVGWVSFPIMAAYGSKIMCSAVFDAGRNEQQVREQDLSAYMMKLGKFKVDYTDSSVTGSIFGMAKRKAVYRRGLGATVVSELSEQQIRSQIFRLPEKPNINPDTISWPMGDRLTEVFPIGVDSSKLATAIKNIFVEQDTILPIRTRAVVVVYKGQLIAERYADGFDAHTKLAGWSMTKSIFAALTGILVKQGRLQIDESAPVPEWSDVSDPRHRISIKNLLQQRSGLEFEEVYSKASDATRMLYEKADMAAFTASHHLKNKPGSVFYYSSGNSNILSRIIRETLGDSLYYNFPYKQLFYKLGMYSAVIEPDASGTFVGSSYMYATARDWARFGLLYLNDGIYNSERILPERWVKQSTSPAPGAVRGYGFQIWLNSGSDSFIRHFPNAPADMYYADGFEGQMIFVIPSKDLVVVRLGLTQHNNFDGNKFLKEILAAIRQD